MWVTFACQYGDDGWEDGDLLHQGENWNEKQKQIRLHSKQTVTSRRRSGACGLVCGLHSTDGHLLLSAFCLPLIPSHQFSSFFPPSLFQNKIRSNEEAEGNKDSLILLREMSAARQVFPGRITTEASGCEAQPSPGLPALHSASLWMLTQALLLLLGHSPSHFSHL